MDIHYNAFISYRHHPDDIRVAREVHQSLEHFLIPKSIRKNAELKGSMHLFRDKEELPITSNLNDDIEEALKNADFLIVICSVHTKESIWVQREIELFLKTHDRNRVLTVLANGEPYDVIPEILLYDDVVDPVTGEMTRKLVEPLSCDWRIGRRKAKREELPRLAAPLLGCSYDELRQRQRQYRMRRLITIFTLALLAALGLAAYFLQTSITIHKANLQIQENLEASQRNQSRHLATASAERLSEGDRLTAIFLAMAALPDETGNRPYVVEAERALIDALGVYQENSQILAVGAVSPGSQAIINEFWASQSGNLLYLYDNRKQVTVWDTETFQKLFTWDQSQEFLQELIPVQQDLALLLHDTSGLAVLKCVKSDGATLWQMENCMDIAVTEEGNTVLAIIQKEQNDYELRFLDLQTGKLLRESVNLNLYDDLITPWKFCPYTIREGMPILVGCSANPGEKICMFDWNTAEYKELPEEIASHPLMMITRDEKLVTMFSGANDHLTGYFEGNRINSTVYTQVCCYDLKTTTQLWQTEVASPVSQSASLNEIPDGRILCQCGSVFQVLDPATGATINRCEAGSGVMAVKILEQYAQAILEDGYLCNYWYDENYCFEEKGMQSGLWQAEIRDAYYNQQFSDLSRVTIYRRVDPTYLWNYSLEVAVSVNDQRIHGDQWLIQEYDRLYMFDLQTRQLRWKQEIRVRDLLDFSADGTKLWFVDSDGALQAIDTLTGEVTAVPFDITEDDVYDGWFRDGKYYYVAEAFTEDWTLQKFVKVLDLYTEAYTAFEIPAKTETEDTIDYTIAGQWDQYLWLWDETDKLLQLDLVTGQLQVLTEEMLQCPVIAVNADGTSMAITSAERVLVTTPGTTQLKKIAMEEGALAGSLYFYGSELLVLCDDGGLYRYDAEGTLLGRTALEVGYSSTRDLLNVDAATQSKVSWQITQDQKLIVNVCSVGNVIHCDSWKVAATVPGYRLYREEDKTYICCSYSTPGVVGYPNYTVQELRQLAQEELGNYQLTEEQKAAYGIE